MLGEERSGADGEALVAAVLQDPETSPLSPAEKAMLRFVDHVNHESPQITPAHMQPLYAAGWSDDAIYYAVTVCSLFNFYNRWIDATGVHAMPDRDHREAGPRMARAGYVR